VKESHNSQRKRKKKGKAPAQNDESMDDQTLKEGELTIKHHFNYQKVDNIPSHINSAIDQFNVVEDTSQYNKWKNYEYRKKVIKLANKLNENR